MVVCVGEMRLQPSSCRGGKTMVPIPRGATMRLIRANVRGTPPPAPWLPVSTARRAGDRPRCARGRCAHPRCSGAGVRTTGNTMMVLITAGNTMMVLITAGNTMMVLIPHYRQHDGSNRMPTHWRSAPCDIGRRQNYGSNRGRTMGDVTERSSVYPSRWG